MKKLAGKLVVICVIAFALVIGYAVVTPAAGRASGSGIVSESQCPAFMPYLHVTWWGAAYCAAS
jgi:hypothetical protein